MRYKLKENLPFSGVCRWDARMENLRPMTFEFDGSHVREPVPHIYVNKKTGEVLQGDVTGNYWILDLKWLEPEVSYLEFFNAL